MCQSDDKTDIELTDVNLEVGGYKAEGDGYGVDCQRGVRLVMASSYG